MVSFTNHSVDKVIYDREEDTHTLGYMLALAPSLSLSLLWPKGIKQTTKRFINKVTAAFLNWLFDFLSSFGNLAGVLSKL